MKSLGIPRSKVTLRTTIKELFSGPDRVQLWETFRAHALLPALPNIGFGTGWLFAPTSVKDLVSIAISQYSVELREEKRWTHEEVRQIVRQIITEQLGVKKFSDTDEFVRDLGVD